MQLFIPFTSRSIIGALTVFLLVGAPAIAQDNVSASVQDGFNAYHATAIDKIMPYAARGDADFQHAVGVIFRYTLEDIPHAMHWFKEAAEQGHPLANYELGLIYENGLSGQKDVEKAFEYYILSAEGGYDRAQIRAAFLLDSGKGVKHNYKKAFVFLKKAAEHGNARAQYMLGLYYANGLGTEIDYAEALKWYLKAADAGLAVAQNNLGYMYYNGYGAPKDLVQSYVWFDLASITLERQDLRQIAARNRDIVARKLSQTELSEGKILSEQWRLRNRLQ